MRIERPELSSVSPAIGVLFALLACDATSTTQPTAEPVAASRPTERPSSGLALTPPMGFNTWNRFQCDVSEQLVREMADAMVDSGMRDAGYRYVVVDDCWQIDRDEQGVIVADPERFPSGMKALGDYIHERGLLFGLYTDVGPMTCQDRPGSLGYEEIDARTYAEWGVDYVKVDWCHSEGLIASERYRIFRDAFDATGRPMVLSICEWGRNAPFEWAREIGHLWRTTSDIEDSWQSLLWILAANNRHRELAGPGRWNDPDMLQVGNGGMTHSEYRAHFSLWALMAAPLMAGNDLRSMSDEIRELLTNEEVIAVNQDPLGIQGQLVLDRGYGMQLWSKPLSNGDVAVILFNQRTEPFEGYVRWQEIGFPAGAAALVRDLWQRRDLGSHVDDGTYERRFRTQVEPHDVVMLRLTPIV